MIPEAGKELFYSQDESNALNNFFTYFDKFLEEKGMKNQ